jgi:hypothetical protein
MTSIHDTYILVEYQWWALVVFGTKCKQHFSLKDLWSGHHSALDPFQKILRSCEISYSKYTPVLGDESEQC